MTLVKTSAGQQALKDRHGSLTPRQRSAFILFDGKRSTDDVLSATAAMGITREDVQAMIDQGLLASASGGAAAAEIAPPAAAAAAGRAAGVLPRSATRTPTPSPQNSPPAWACAASG